MRYFENLIEKWKKTIREEIEIEKLEYQINLVSKKSPYKGNNSFTLNKYKNELKEAEDAKEKIAKILAGIKSRRIGAIFGK